MPSSPTSFTVTSPPTAAKPNWPSDSWPAQPVRMVSEHPAMANTSTRVQRNDSDAREKKIGISTSTPNSANTPMRPRWRAHQRRRTSSTGRTGTAVATFQPPSSIATRQAREHEHDHERRHEQPQLGDAEVARVDVLLQDHLDDADADAREQRHRQADRIRASSATTSARSSSW